jgi:sirohydrochlorin ferrochelatase
MAATAVLVVAHGSRAAGSVAAFDRLCARLASQLGTPVSPAFLEINQPDIPDAIDAAVERGAQRIVLLLFFLHLGNHVRADIPRLVGAAQRRYPGVAFEIAEPLAEDERLVDILADRAAPFVGAGVPG